MADAASLWYVRQGAAPTAFKFEDSPREDAARTVACLRRAGYHIVLLSGDRPHSVEAAADAAGIGEWQAGLKPDGKIQRIAALQAQGHCVLMAGDGLNDAPALAAAHASVSPSTAADISQTAADAVFQGAKLMAVADLLATARKARRMALENFGIALGYNLFFVPLALAGRVTPLMAAIAMSASSIALTVNALRLRTAKLEAQA